MLAVTPLAVDAYELGGLVGALVPLALGITLLVVGLRQRRAGSVVPAGPTWNYGPSPETAVPPWEPPPATVPDPTWPAPAPSKPRGTALIVAGAILTVLALLGAVVQAATLATSTERRVALPTSVIGLERVEGAGAQIAESALQAAPEDLIDPHAALYGTPGLSVLVIAARAKTSFPSRQLDSFRKGFEGAGGSSLTDGRDVDAGDLGGSARCWVAHINDTTPGVCIFVDRGSLVATIDFLPGGIEEAAKRGLQIREATVHET